MDLIDQVSQFIILFFRECHQFIHALIFLDYNVKTKVINIEHLVLVEQFFVGKVYRYQMGFEPTNSSTILFL